MSENDNTGSSSKSIQYETRYVAFLDILGFKDIVDSKTAEWIVDALQHALNTHEHAKQVNALFQHVMNGKPGGFTATGHPGDSLFYAKSHDIGSVIIKSTTFSDSVILSSQDSDSGLLAITMAIEFFARDLLLNKGVLVRGGMSKGEIYHEDSLVFGPGLNEAYLLESTFAHHPRILISERVIHDSDTFEHFKGIARVIYAEDEDGLSFFDILKSRPPCDSAICKIKDHFKENKKKLSEQESQAKNVKDKEIYQQAKLKIEWFQNYLENHINASKT